jgi:4-carboxymuconolactone decarboxylase
MPAKRKAVKKTSKKPAKMAPTRLPALAEDQLTAEQRSLMGAIASGPRGTFKMSGPFYCYLHAPAFGELAQKLGPIAASEPRSHRG